MKIEVPDGHEKNPPCPECGGALGSRLRELYTPIDPTAIGGEHGCPHCGASVTVFVDYPSPTFRVTGDAAPGVVRLHSARVRRGLVD